MSLVAGRSKPHAYPILARIAFWTSIVCGLVIFASWRWLWNVTVLDYGISKDTYFDVTEAYPGQTVQLWFDGVTWHRIWDSQLHVRVTCRVTDPRTGRTINGRIDFEPHQIDVPSEPGPVPRKHRTFVVPSECLPGPLTWKAEATSTGFPFGSWNVRRAYPPVLRLNVIPKPGT